MWPFQVPSPVQTCFAMIGFPFTCAHLTPPGLRRLAVNWVSHCQGTPYGPPMGPLSVFFPQDSHVECSTHTYTANDVEYVYLETTPTTSVQKSGCGHRRHRRPSAVTHPPGGLSTAESILAFSWRDSNVEYRPCL